MCYVLHQTSFNAMELQYVSLTRHTPVFCHVFVIAVLYLLVAQVGKYLIFLTDCALRCIDGKGKWLMGWTEMDGLSFHLRKDPTCCPGITLSPYRKKKSLRCQWCCQRKLERQIIKLLNILMVYRYVSQFLFYWFGLLLLQCLKEVFLNLFLHHVPHHHKYSSVDRPCSTITSHRRQVYTIICWLLLKPRWNRFKNQRRVLLICTSHNCFLFGVFCNILSPLTICHILTDHRCMLALCARKQRHIGLILQQEMQNLFLITFLAPDCFNFIQTTGRSCITHSTHATVWESVF